MRQYAPQQAKRGSRCIASNRRSAPCSRPSLRLAELYADKERLDRELLERQHRRERIRYDLEQLAARTKQERVELESIESRLHALQMELQEVRIRTEELVSRVQTDLNINLAELYASYEHASRTGPRSRPRSTI